MYRIGAMTRWVYLFGALLALLGCAAAVLPDAPTDTPPAVDTPEPETPTVPDDPPAEPPALPEGLSGPVLAALYDGTTVSLWDGTSVVPWQTTTSAVRGTGARVAVSALLYSFSETGGVEGTTGLPAEPDAVAVSPRGTYTLERISAEEAMALDWTPGARTRVYRDGVELGDWHERAWTLAAGADAVWVASNGDVIALDTVGRFRDLDRPALDGMIVWAVPDAPDAPGSGFVFHCSSVSPETYTVYDAAHPEGAVISRTGAPWRWGGQPWIRGPADAEGDAVWYTGYGDTWDPVAWTFTASATGLRAFRSSNMGGVVLGSGDDVYQFPYGSETPTMLGAWADDGVYMIEANTGTVWRYSPDTDVLTYVESIYVGDGHDETGQTKAVTLAPQVIVAPGPYGETTALFYHDAGTVWAMDTATGMVAPFGPEMEVWAW